MKNVKQIFEKYEPDESDRKLSALVEAGLLDENKLHILKRSLNKSPRDMTVVEKTLLVGIIEGVIEQIEGAQLNEASSPDYLSKFDDRRPAGYPSEKNIPVIIILKRKAIRVFPDHQKIALYYSQALDKYISIPFGSNTEALGMHMSESYVNKAIRKVQEQREAQKIDEVAPVVVAGGIAAARVIGGAIAKQYAKRAARNALRKNITSASTRAGKKLPQKPGILSRLKNSKPGAAAGAAAGWLAKTAGEGLEKAAERDTPQPNMSYDTRAAGRQGLEVGRTDRITPDVSTNSLEAQKMRRVWGTGASAGQVQKESKNNLTKIRAIVENDIDKLDISFGDKPITINNRVARKLITVYESLTKENRRKVEKMLNEDATSFKKVINFVVRQI